MRFQFFTKTSGRLDGLAKPFTSPAPMESWEASAGKNAKVEHPPCQALTKTRRTFDDGNLRSADLGEGILAVQSDSRTAVRSPGGAQRITVRTTSGSVAAPNLMGEELHPEKREGRLNLTFLPDGSLLLVGGAVEPIRKPKAIKMDITRDVIEI